MVGPVDVFSGISFAQFLRLQCRNQRMLDLAYTRAMASMSTFSTLAFAAISLAASLGIIPMPACSNASAASKSCHFWLFSKNHAVFIFDHRDERVSNTPEDVVSMQFKPGIARVEQQFVLPAQLRIATPPAQYVQAPYPVPKINQFTDRHRHVGLAHTG